ncbi:hypothetical protein ACFQL1_13810 [Halomicroarcula sp. GCM10025709]|uniref:hypothetical protein n=1 Tax=Haloarcula TaxID=2237 RepID=UPI0024C408FB|nr:hypothetical protein [Halomicroarcula sp. YJ-61-S]
MNDRDRLYEHLAATAERPVERTASHWLGEAEAIARDLARSDLGREVRRERLATVASLLSEVEETGDPVADDHLDRAQSLVTALLAE